jgi:hypothetical protein
MISPYKTARTAPEQELLARVDRCEDKDQLFNFMAQVLTELGHREIVQRIADKLIEFHDAS